MRKLLVALMMVAFAATAFAADVKFSGTYEIDGKYEKNYGEATTSGDVVTNQYYEHDLDLWMKVATDKDTFFNLKMELLDDSWDNNASNDAGYATDTEISVQRAWIGHNFGKVLLEAGLMNGGTWGYAFGDNGEGKQRIKATFNVAGGKLHFLTQKNEEEGSSANTVKDNEKDDSDMYSIGYKGTFGGIMVAPKLDYTLDSTAVNDNDSDGNKTIDFDIAVGGKFGIVTVEAEYQLKKVTRDASNLDDYSIYGAYLNANAKLGAATVGGFVAIASVDEDTQIAYDMSDDFDSTFILGDDLGYGGGDDLKGYNVYALYATYDVNDKLNLMAKYAYATSNYEDDDTSAMEIDLAANYAITKELNYYVNVGYATIDADGSDDPEPLMLVKHGLVLSF